MKKRQVIAATIVAGLLVVAMDLATNSIDTERFSWDFRYYIDMAEHGFRADMASPFAYRYLTPMLAGGISGLLRVPVGAGFAIIAYIGAIAQLLSVWLFTRWYTHSARGAWLAMLVAAFSLFNVKFLLFDIFRPDHLAYPLIFLQAYFALTGRFIPLLISSLIGCQIREFNGIPLVAYLVASLWSLGATTPSETRRRITLETIVGTLSLVLALALPRLLIPVSEDFQFASFTRDGLLRGLLAPLIPTRDANFIYSVVAYTLPLLMLASPRTLLTKLRELRRSDAHFLGVYSVLVLAFSFLGGTDFFRFSTYLVLPQSVLLGVLATDRSTMQLSVMLASVFVFNRIWLPFPTNDVNDYLDFYGAYGTRFNASSALRLAECAVLIIIGVVMRRRSMPASGKPANIPE